VYFDFSHELAQDHGRFVLFSQPFPVSALIAAQVIDELNAVVPALQCNLTPAEMRWLNLEE
jgi:hypothetical protein